MINIFKKTWVLELIGIIVISVLIWFIGPLIAIAGNVLLESELGRIVAIAILFGAWLSYRLLKWLFANRRERALMHDLSAGADPNDSRSASVAELDVLNRGFTEALALLKTARGKKGGSKQFLYELPWYAIIGAPGSGKTTALINSGLRFPLAEKLGSHAVKGVSGTRDCDWWFSDEVVFLDTAGRYTTQDSHREIDAAAWHGFLQLLKKYRPRRPLNGVLVAVSVSDLLQQSEEESAKQARAVRQRIMELNGQLGVRLPVYVLFTKTDLVAGFTDFFVNLTEAERNQVWGETFTPSPNKDELERQLQQFDHGFDDLMERLRQRRLSRIQDERDVGRRAAIYDFPQQMNLLKPVLLGFLDAAFSTNRYEEPFYLRGVYFTSGTQEGTPIDRILTALAGGFRLDRQAAPMMSGRGKSFFLTNLLRNVIFPEAGLAGVDQKVERRFRVMKLASFAAAFLVVVLGVIIWSVSNSVNRQALGDVDKQIEAFRALNAAAANSRDGFLALLPKLNAMLAAKQVFPQTGWSGGFGLYQGDKIEAGVNLVYERLLRESLAPLIVSRLQERMRSEEGNNLDVLYQLLRVYLMFAEPARMDAKAAKLWIRSDWQNLYAMNPEAQAKLFTHLEALLSLNLDPAPVDSGFVNAVRDKLTRIPLANQIYSRFKSENLFDHDHDVYIASQLAPNGGKVFMAANGKELESLIVPGLFSSYGYIELFLKKGMDFVKEASEQNWVLGNKSPDSEAETERLFSDFQRLYLADYQKNWDGVLTAVKFKPQITNMQLVNTLDLLSRPDSPLKFLLELVEKNTSLSKLSVDMANSLAKAAGGLVPVPDAAQKLLAKVRQGNNPGADPVTAVEAYFEPFNQQARGSDAKPAPIVSTLDSIKALHDYLLQIVSGPNSTTIEAAAKSAGGGAINPIQAAKADFARLPGPMAAALTSLTSMGGEQIKTGAKNQLNEMLKTSVTIPCKAALAGRYPFAANTQQDVLLADFAKVFAANGLIDQFFNTNLKAFVDTTSTKWTEMNSVEPLGLSATAIRQFQLAARIRDAFFAGGGTSPQVQFELKPLDLDSRVGTFRLNIEGQELVYKHGPEQITKFQWPGANNSAGVRVVFETLDEKQLSRFKEGAWALFRMLDEFNIEKTNLPDRFRLSVVIEGYTAHFELRAASVYNPFGVSEYQSFQCPELL